MRLSAQIDAGDNPAMAARSGGDSLRTPANCGVRLHANNVTAGLPSTSSAQNNNPFAKRKVDKFNMSNLEWIDNIPECPVYCPTKEEFEDRSHCIYTENFPGGFKIRYTFLYLKPIFLASVLLNG